MRTSSNNAVILFFVLLLFIFASACKSGVRVKNVDTKGFKKSTLSINALTDKLIEKHQQNAAACFEGKAKITVRTTDDNDTGSSDFIVCEDQAYFRIKNRLGIEGLKIWQQADSLFIYDLIKKEAFAVHQNNLVDPRLNALAAIQLYSLIVPIPKASALQLLESDSQYLLIFKDEQNWLFDKESLDLATVIKPISSSTTDRIHFYRYAEQNNLRFPTQLALLNSTEQTNIFIQIQRLATSSTSDNKLLEIDIPESIIIQR